MTSLTRQSCSMLKSFTVTDAENHSLLLFVENSGIRFSLKVQTFSCNGVLWRNAGSVCTRSDPNTGGALKASG